MILLWRHEWFVWKTSSPASKALLRGIDDRVRGIEVGAGELKGRLASLPGTWAMIATVIGGQVALAGLLFGAMRLGLPH